MPRLSWLLATVLLAAACSSQSASVSDGGSDVDSGSASVDAGNGSVDADAGQQVDAGTHPDAGTGSTDAGMTGSPDAGSGQVTCRTLASGEDFIYSPVILNNTLFFSGNAGLRSIALPNGTPATVVTDGSGGIYVGVTLAVWKGHLLYSFRDSSRHYGIWQANADGTGGAPLVTNESQPVANLVVDGDQLYWVLTDFSARTSAVRTLDASGNAVTLYQSDTYIPTGYNGNMLVAGGTMFWTSQVRDPQGDWPDPGVLYSAPVSNPQQVTTTKIDPQPNVNGALNGSCYLAADVHSVYFDCLDAAPGAVGRFDPTTGTVTQLTTDMRSYSGMRGGSVAVDESGFYSAWGDLTRFALDGSGGTHITDVPNMATDAVLALDATTVYVGSNYGSSKDTLLACSK